jgi:tetratricopeptide (TPR) repeat protein
MLLMTSQLDLQRARQMLEKALGLDPHFAAAQAEYGFTHLLMIDAGWSNDSSWLYKAEEDIRRVLQDAPNSSRAHAALAAVYIYMGRKELAPAEAEKALSINPQELDGYIWLVNYHMLNEDYARAEAFARQALERAPLYFPARMNLGEALRQQGNTAGAGRELEKILELDPQNIYAIRFLARTCTDVGDLPKARRTLERGRAADRQNYHIRMAWAILLALEGKRTEAIREMDEEVLKYAAVVVDETQVASQVYAVLGETSKAIEWLDRAVRNGDERAEWFRRDPALASIRAQPRFKQILDSIAIRRQQRQNK